MNKIISSAILFVAGAMMVASNVNAQGITIEKRHYKGGYYIDFGKKKAEAKATSAKQTIPAIGTSANSTIALTTPSADEQMQMVPVTNYANTPAQKQSKSKASHHSLIERSVIAAAKSISNNNSASYINDVVASPDVINSTKNVEGGGGTVPLILLVILAIFISPLAVYLHDGQIAPHFWWVLVLWLLGGGLAFGVGYYGGLLLLIAIIWALIIVLGSASGR